MVTFNLNGEDRRFEESLTVAELIRSLQIKTSSIAVEVNRVIVPRSSHETHRLEEGDRVEIVTFVGGG
jgi:sulfur carrier protein